MKVVCGPGVLKKLFLDPLDLSISADLLGDLAALAANYSADVGPVVAALLSGAVSCLAASNFSNATSNSQEANLTPKELGTIFLRVAAAGLVEGDVVVPCMSRLLETHVAWEGKQGKVQGKESQVASEYRTAVEAIVRACSQRFPAEFDAAVQAASASRPASSSESETLSLLLKRVFEKSPYKLPSEAGVGLLLGLSHSSSKLRAEALQVFGSTLPLTDCGADRVTSDVVGLCSAALACLDPSSDLKVVVAACDSEVLRRAARVLPSTEVFSAVHSVFSCWAGKVAHAPKQARTALAAILSGVFHPSVLASIATTEEAADTLLLLLLSALQICRHSLPRTEKATKYCRHILAVVSSGLSHLSQHSLLLASYDAQAADAGSEEEEDDVDDLCDASWSRLSAVVAKNITLLGFDGIQALLGVYASLKRTSDGSIEFPSALAGLVALLSSVCDDMATAAAESRTKSKEAAVTGVAQQAFSVLLSWSTFFYERVRAGDLCGAEQAALNDQVDEALSSALQVAISGGVFPDHAEGANSTSSSGKRTMADLCSVYTDCLVAEDASARLLVSLLDLMGSDSERATPLIGLCLQTFYSSSPLQILARISSSPHLDEEVEQAMEESYSADVVLGAEQAAKACVVSADARASALYTLSAYLRFVLAEAQETGELFLADVLTLLPAMVACLSETQSSIRVAALTVTDELCNLSSQLQVEVTTGKKKAKYSSTVVVLLAQLYSSKSSSIAVDESIASQVLEDDVFQAQDSASAQLADLLLHLAVALGWKAPRLANGLLRACVQKCAAGVSWPWAKQLVTASLVEEAEWGAEASDVRELGRTLLRVCMWNITEATSSSDKQDLVAVLCSLLPQKNATEMSTLLRSVLFGELAALSLADSPAPGWLSHVGEAERVQLFTSITAEMAADTQGNCRDDFVSSLQAIPVPVECAFDALVQCQTSINSHLAAFEASGCDDAMEMEVSAEEEEEEEQQAAAGSVGLGMALPLQFMCMYLDSISPVLQAASEGDFHHLSKSSVVLLDILASLNMSQISTVLTIGYCRGLLLDLACTCLGKIYSLVPASAAPATTPAKGNKRSAAANKARGSASTASGMYSPLRVNSDIEAILQCLQLSSTSYVQTFSLKLFDILLSMQPSAVERAVLSLSQVLAAATTTKDNISCQDSNGLVAGIIRTTTSIRARNSNKFGGVVISYPQEVLEPLFFNFSVMAFDKRLALMKIAFQEFDDNVLPISIALALAHSLAVYGSTGRGSNNSVTKHKSNADTAQKENGDVFILLSRSAQRKANASRKVSESEEFFSLATKASFMKPMGVQMQSLVVLTRMARNLLTYLVRDEDVDMASLLDEEEQESLKVNGQSVTAEDEMLTQMDDHNPDLSKAVFSLSKYVAYANKLLQSKTSADLLGEEDEHMLDDTASNGAALTILMMEYTLEFVENPKFHECIVSSLGSSGGDAGEEVQRMFLVLCEQLLELLAFSTHIQHALARSKTLLPVRLGGPDNGQRDLDVRPSAIAKRVWMLSLDVIHAIQRLLDGPTFIVILQELINHDHISVRQKSLQILGDRLQLVSGSKAARQDSALYLDLAAQLLQSVVQTVPEDALAAFSGGSDGSVDHEMVGQLGIAQSALLGIDILARQFASAKEWATPMTEALGQLAGMADAVAESIKELPVDAAVTQEVFKLLGSFYLCCGTLCSAAKVRSLPFLESLLGRMLGLIEVQGATLLQHEDRMADDASSAISRAQCRTLTLLVRSCVSAVASIVTVLSSFFHPYMPRFLEAVTPLQSLRHTPDASLLARDIDQCLFVVTTKVPSRLSIPAILQASVSIFTNKKDASLDMLHATAAKLADFQFSNWEALDRGAVTNHLDSLQSISLVGLNYRYTSGDQSEAGDAVDDHVCRAVIEFCLKLTESELREFLVQLLDMKDDLLADAGASPEERFGDWRMYSRSVVFFQLLSGLNGKLKHIFVPLMGLVWQGAADHLTSLIDFVKAMKPFGQGVTEGGKKGKKRKLLAAGRDSGVVTACTGAQQQVLQELLAGSAWVLKSVRKCCVHDNINFIDQFQYEVIIRQLSALYALREAFREDAEYLAFAADLVLPCIVQIVIAVGKDLLWKSLNHDILVMMRSSQKSVKTAALRGLQKLFTDVGEEYLILLPECLPFLSEVLEDSDSGVVALASEVIQSIEDLSGESLDSYLR